MPRRGRRSEAAKRRWRRWRLGFYAAKPRTPPSSPQALTPTQSPENKMSLLLESVPPDQCAMVCQEEPCRPSTTRVSHVQQLVRIKEEEQSPDVDQQYPGLLHIKKEEKENWTSQEAEQLHIRKEKEDWTSQEAEQLHIRNENWTSQEPEQLNRTIKTEVNSFDFTVNPLKSEDDEDKLFPQLHMCKMEDGELLTSTSVDPMEVSAGEEDFTEIEIIWDPDESDSWSTEDEDEDEESDSQLSYSSDSGPTSEDSDWMESMASTSGVEAVISSDMTSSSTSFCKRKSVRKTTESHRIHILKNMPTSGGDHNYAKVVLTFSKPKTL